MARLESVKDRIELRNGTGVPCVGFGTWKLPEGEAGLDALGQALADGYRHIDTAEVYGTEPCVGRALRDSGVAREDLFVTSKVWNDHRGRDTALKAFEGSLERLGLDYLDLYLVHWPATQGADDEWQSTNRQTWRALEELYRDGRVRAIGVSNFERRHLEPLMDAADILPMVNQIELHPGCAQEETRSFCDRHDIVVEAWSPLGSGRVLGSALLADIAARYGCTTAQLCLRWCLQRSAIPLPKSADPARISENARVFWFDISEEDLRRIDELELS
ncbi:aldo/keto reductase [Gordonibacter sp. An230]|uniref:aldo/keto reductase n=1 Tax=Gordonibacter sp. An230 TaxID=1965592 RepID=UPI000B367C7A|nr:aldo/keto reductase [Gordonibacter sp. An230]OUO88907.1 aldo/keto reductase [Gordonibacter sp. An230]